MSIKMNNDKAKEKKLTAEKQAEKWKIGYHCNYGKKSIKSGRSNQKDGDKVLLGYNNQKLSQK